MKEVIFENVLNKERFRCADVRDVQVIDGVEFLKVSAVGTQRILLMRKDSLRRIAVKAQ